MKEYFGKGLILETYKTGQFWRFKYRFQGKEKLISLGSKESFSPDDAITTRDRARELLMQGIDPSEYRKQKPFISKFFKGLESLR